MKAGCVLVVLACGCFVRTPPMRFGAGKSPEEAQQETLTKLMPPLLVADQEWHGEVRALKLRVWADDEFRAQNVQWQHTFQEELDYANSVLAPMLGITFSAEYRVWTRHAPGATLDEDLAALAQQDPGDGVFSVVGLTSALGLASATFEQLGIGALPGRYVMLRGYADVSERKAFDAAFPRISQEERQAVHEARRRHKTTAVLLHELGHNLGAGHEILNDSIMNAQYSDHSTSFSKNSREIMLATLDARLGRPSEYRPRAVAEVKRHPSLNLEITAAGEITTGGQHIDLDTLDELFRRSLLEDAETEVVVKVGASAPHDAVLRLFDRAKAAGIHRTSVSGGDNQ